MLVRFDQLDGHARQLIGIDERLKSVVCIFDFVVEDGDIVFFEDE